MTGIIDLALYDLWRCQSRHGKRLWGPLKTPEVLEGRPIGARDPGIQVLPNEVLRMIFELVDRPVDKLRLAMTCRQFFRVASDFNLSIPSAAKHRERGADCPGMLRILHNLRPLDARKRANRAWALCCDCYSYRPKKKAYWLAKGKQYKVNAKSGCSAREGYGEIMKEWCMKSSYSYQCPECWCKEYLDKNGHPKNCEKCT
ncbi:unnamed protein product [Clonostachys chloroleuca]|uniref:F-box domain-containing protein n=1 Tax=Clonostachys chloroleuca TaxID=1926264 RepID=A0AA35Q442_9HYPO|nr:unnamed protein product [Clonostachys chloroleuca]